MTKDRNYSWIVSLKYVFFVLYGFLLVYVSWASNQSMDEFATMHTTSSSIINAFLRAYSFEGQPPVYFLLLTIFRKIHDSLLFARMFSVLQIYLGVWFLQGIAKEIIGKPLPFAIIVLILLNPFVIWIGTEARLYALAFSLSSGIIWFTIRLLRYSRLPDAMLLLGLSIMGILTQYFFGFLLASLALSILLIFGFRRCLYFLGIQAIVFLVFLMSYIYMADPFNIAPIGTMHLTTTDFLSLKFRAPQNLLLSMDKIDFPPFVRRFVLLFFVFFVVQGLRSLYLKRKEPEYSSTWNLVLLLALSFLFCFLMYTVLFIVSELDFGFRYMTLTLPLLYFVFYAMTFLDRLGKYFFVSVFVIFFTLANFRLYTDPVKDLDVRELLLYLKNNTIEGEPIMFYENVIALPVLANNASDFRIEQLPKKYEFSITSDLGKVYDIAIFDSSIASVTKGQTVVTLINFRVAQGFSRDKDLLLLDESMKKQFQVIRDTIFIGRNKNWPVRIRRYIRNKT